MSPRVTAASGSSFSITRLFRHMTVFDNVAFGLSGSARDVARLSKREAIGDRVRHLLEMVQLGGLGRPGILPSCQAGSANA